MRNVPLSNLTVDEMIIRLLDLSSSGHGDFPIFAFDSDDDGNPGCYSIPRPEAVDTLKNLDDSFCDYYRIPNEWKIDGRCVVINRGFNRTTMWEKKE